MDFRRLLGRFLCESGRRFGARSALNWGRERWWGEAWKIDGRAGGVMLCWSMLGKKRVTCGGEGGWVAAVERDAAPAGEECGGDDESD